MIGYHTEKFAMQGSALLLSKVESQAIAVWSEDHNLLRALEVLHAGCLSARCGAGALAAAAAGAVGPAEGSPARAFARGGPPCAVPTVP